ncbi:MAG TPA: cell cycle transcriptional regulator TrcR, partial [Sphingomonadales bacterium]|nr:cell cycle transcriptional regulator TrcR [Sphingomonadales bacterium]
MSKLLMPMATAVWLVDNTSLSFRQIAKFCGLHPLEVQGIADETVGQHIVGIDPTQTGQLTWAEIERCQKNKTAELQLVHDEVEAAPRTKGPRYTPVSKRQDKPAAIAWMLRAHPEISDNQICKLIGTTKPTINAIRQRSHWNMTNIKPQNPVGLGLCSSTDLDKAVTVARKRARNKALREAKAKAKAEKLAAEAVAAAAAASAAAPQDATGAPAAEAAPTSQP